MTNPSKISVVTAAVLCLCAQTLAMRGLLEKEITWSAANGKSQTCIFWTIYLGDYDCALSRKFPGEDSMPVAVKLNLTLYSSGYIEGTGFCDKGKVQCNAKFKIAGPDADRILSFDDIFSVFNNGTKVKLADTAGTQADLLIDIEGTALPCRKMVATRYNFVNTEGERTLKPDAVEKDVPITEFSFTKHGTGGSEEPVKKAARKKK